MRIGLDLLAINHFREHGIGFYMINFCREIIDNYPNHELVFVNWSNKRVVEKIWGEGFKYNEICLGFFNWDDCTEVEDSIRKIVEDYQLDIYLDFTPSWGERPRLKKAWLKDTLLIGIIHDFLPYALRDLYYYNKRIEYVNYVKSVANLYEYDKLLSNSQYTKQDAVRILDLPDQHIDCIYCSIGGDNKGNARAGEEPIAPLIDGEYYFFPAGDVPQKNVERLLFAYFKLLSECKNAPKLVITGRFAARKKSRYSRLLKEYDAGTSVVFMGFVSSEELDQLFEQCRWVLYPSLYEGFGMPIIEAWKHHKPILTSDCTSMAEIASSAAVLVNPNDEESIYEGLHRISNMTTDERNELVLRGEERGKQFNWKNTVSLFFKAIKGIDNKITFECRSELEDHLVAKLISEYDKEYKNIGIKSNVTELQKNVAYFHMLDLWMQLLEIGGSISEYLLNNGYRVIAIYGLGIVANHLITELDRSGIRIAYILDQEARCIRDSFPVYRIEDEHESVDAIIITTISEYKEVCNRLDARCPILSLYDVVENTLREMKGYSVT